MSASFLERYVVTEEMRVANAPTRRFFVADRQSGPVLLKYAPEHIKMDILPRICRGEVCFAIGMSEPNSGSDLFAAKTKATKTDGGFLINGTKIWTSSAHIADYMIAIFRTSPPTKENRRHGLTQFLVNMKQPGIQVNPIGQITGQSEFNEVVFTDHFVPDDHMLGEIDGAWKQATCELAYERSGPERFLETYYVLTELVRAVGTSRTPAAPKASAVSSRNSHHAADVGLGRRHAAGRQGAGGGSLHRQGHRHDLGAATAAPGARPRGLRRGDRDQPRDAGKAAVVRDQDRAQAHHPGRHHRSAARHHRPRARFALGARLVALTSTRKPMSKFTDIGVEKHGHVGLIEIRKPPLNFFDVSLINQIADALEEFDKDIEIRASVLAAQGKAFCAGANFGDPARQEQEEKAKTRSGLNLPINHLYVQAVRIFRNKKPIVAAVHGAAIGGGLGLAVSADFRVTCPEARFAANFTKLGFHPGFGLTATLPELVGKNNAELIFYTSRRVTGEEATRMGLANICVPQDQVRAEAMKLAAEIAECSPLGLISTRATMRAGLADRVLAATNHELVEQTKLRATEDFKEGVKATSERRVANFKGKVR